MNIQYNKIENTNFTLIDILELLHEVFADRVAEGMNFLAARMTIDQLRNDVEGAVVFVAYDRDTGVLLGTGSLGIKTLDNGEKCGHLFNLAVSNKAKRQGVATSLYIYIERECLAHKCSYITSDTAINAISSIKYHLKNGFHIVGIVSWPTTNYYSYLFRKQLKHPSPFDSKLYCKYTYLKSYFKTRLRYRKDGTRRF